MLRPGADEVEVEVESESKVCALMETQPGMLMPNRASTGGKSVVVGDEC